MNVSNIPNCIQKPEILGFLIRKTEARERERKYMGDNCFSYVCPELVA